MSERSTLLLLEDIYVAIQTIFEFTKDTIMKNLNLISKRVML